MIIVVNRFILRKEFNAVTLWPFVVLRKAEFRKDKRLLFHERIHLRQQAELLVLPFYLWYGIEFLLRWVQYLNRHEAYRNISFEREAYHNDKDLTYLKKRSLWRFVSYL